MDGARASMNQNQDPFEASQKLDEDNDRMDDLV